MRGLLDLENLCGSCAGLIYLGSFTQEEAPDLNMKMLANGTVPIYAQERYVMREAGAQVLGAAC